MSVSFNGKLFMGMDDSNLKKNNAKYNVDFSKKVGLKQINLIRKSKTDYDMEFKLSNNMIMKGHFKKFSWIWKGNGNKLGVEIVMDDITPKKKHRVNMLISDKKSNKKVFNLLRYSYGNMSIGKSGKLKVSSKLKTYGRTKRTKRTKRSGRTRRTKRTRRTR